MIYDFWQNPVMFRVAAAADLTGETTPNIYDIGMIPEENMP